MGLIHLDAGVIIGFADSLDAHHRSATGVLADALERGDRLLMAASAFGECLVGPTRRGGEALDIFFEIFDGFPIEVVDLTRPIAMEAARMRAAHKSLRMPDALVIATAATGGADLLVTTDRRWPTAERLGIDFDLAVL